MSTENKRVMERERERERKGEGEGHGERGWRERERKLLSSLSSAQYEVKQLNLKVEELQTALSCFTCCSSSSSSSSSFENIVDYSKDPHAKEYAAYVDHLQELTITRQSKVFTASELEEIGRERQLPVKSWEDFIQCLNLQMYILPRGNRKWELYR